MRGFSWLPSAAFAFSCGWYAVMQRKNSMTEDDFDMSRADWAVAVAIFVVVMVGILMPLILKVLMP
jgi:hypothetical protein